MRAQLAALSERRQFMKLDEFDYDFIITQFIFEKNVPLSNNNSNRDDTLTARYMHIQCFFSIYIWNSVESSYHAQYGHYHHVRPTNK